VVCSSGVVVAAACGVGEGEIGVVYELEFASSFAAFWGFGGDAVRVGFECCSVTLLVAVVMLDGNGERWGEVPFVGIANLLLTCSGGNS
jgi:hypothetical protein